MQFKLYFIGIILIIISISACNRPLEFESPVLSQEKMIAVLADIHLAEGRITEYGAKQVGERDSLAAMHYNTVFKIHNIEAEDFDQSMNAYMTNPEALSKLYEKVLEKLTKDELIYGKH